MGEALGALQPKILALPGVPQKKSAHQLSFMHRCVVKVHAYLHRKAKPGNW